MKITKVRPRMERLGSEGDGRGLRVLRGGSWGTSRSTCVLVPGLKLPRRLPLPDTFGFRLARDID